MDEATRIYAYMKMDEMVKKLYTEMTAIDASACLEYNELRNNISRRLEEFYTVKGERITTREHVDAIMQGTYELALKKFLECLDNIH